MSTTFGTVRHRSSSQSSLQHFGKHLAYVLAGFPIALVSFPALVIMTTVSVATLVVWLGVLLLPLSLFLASAFARLSKWRLRTLGKSVEPVTYRSVAPGIFGKLRIVTDPRRWLDLAFEVLIAFPMRVTNFVVTITWSLVGLGGVTYFFWSIFLPDQRNVIQLLRIIEPSLIPDSPMAQYLLDSGAHFVVGLVFLITLTPVVSGLAKCDAALTATLLGSPAAPYVVDMSAERSYNTTAWARAGTGLVAISLLAVGWPVLAAVYSAGVVQVMVWVGLHCAALLITLRWTWTGLALSAISSGMLIALTAEAGVSVWPWPVTVLLTQCAVLIVAGLVRPWYYAISGWSASVLITLVALIVVAPELPAGAIGNSIIFGSVSAGAVAAATLCRMWIRNAGRLQAAERTSAIQDRRSKELAERTRIARELHDVVAHSMSVISVQAATAQYRNPDIGANAQREFDEIAGSSRQALSEMRLLLSILRNEDDAPTAPTPGLADIHALVDATRASGTVIHYRGLDQTNAGALSATPPATALAAYRTVQEALSNALRHAPGAVIDVELNVGSTADDSQLLTIAVTNGFHEPNAASTAGSGLGLTGIRERIAAVGGTFESGTTHDGGFAVSAKLPL